MVDARIMPTSRRHGVSLCALLLASALVAGCAIEPAPPVGYDQRFLTRDGVDATAISVRGGEVLVTAPITNTGSNSRTVFRRTHGAASVDHGSCATTTHSGLPVQEGVALRVRTTAGTTRAITVTKSIWAGADRIYNVHTWDTSRAPVLEQVAGHDLSAAITSDEPRRLCARVSGSRVELKVWTIDTAEPAWGDPVATRTVDLPDGWAGAGRPGWYVGHVPPGGWASYRDLSTSLG